MYDNKMKEMEEALDASELLIEELLKEVTGLKEKNKIMRSDIFSLEKDSISSELLASAIREIQDEMKRQNHKLILVNEV